MLQTSHVLHTVPHEEISFFHEVLQISLVFLPEPHEERGDFGGKKYYKFGEYVHRIYSEIPLRLLFIQITTARMPITPIHCNKDTASERMV